MPKSIGPADHPELEPNMKPYEVTVTRMIEGWKTEVCYRDDKGNEQKLTFGLSRGGVRKGESKLPSEEVAMTRGLELALADAAFYAPGIEPIILDTPCVEKKRGTA